MQIQAQSQRQRDTQSSSFASQGQQQLQQQKQQQHQLQNQLQNQHQQQHQLQHQQHHHQQQQHHQQKRTVTELEGIEDSINKVARVFKENTEKQRALEADVTSKSKQLQECQNQMQLESLCLAKNSAYVSTLSHALDNLSRSTDSFQNSELSMIQSDYLDLGGLVKCYRGEFDDMTSELTALTSYLATILKPMSKMLHDKLLKMAQCNADNSDTTQRLTAQEAEIDKQLVTKGGESASCGILRDEQAKVTDATLIAQDESLARANRLESSVKETQIKLDAATDAAKQKLASLTQRLEGLRKSIVDDKAQKLDLENSIAAEHLQGQELSNKVYQAEQQLLNSTGKHHSAIDADKLVRVQTEQFTSQLKSTRAEVCRTKDKLDAACQLLEDANKRLQKSEDDINESTAKVAAAKTRLAESVAEQSELQMTIPKLHKQQVSLQGQYNNHLAKAKEAFEIEGSRSSESKLKLAGTNEALEELDSRATQGCREIDAYARQQNESADRAKELKAECSLTMTQDLETSIKAMESEIINLQAAERDISLQLSEQKKRPKTMHVKLNNAQGQAVDDRAAAEIESQRKILLSAHKKELSVSQASNRECKDECITRLAKEISKLSELRATKEKGLKLLEARVRKSNEEQGSRSMELLPKGRERARWQGTRVQVSLQPKPTCTAVAAAAATATALTAAAPTTPQLAPFNRRAGRQQSSQDSNTNLSQTLNTGLKKQTATLGKNPAAGVFLSTNDWFDDRGSW